MEREEADQFNLWVKIQEQPMFFYDNDDYRVIVETVRANTKTPVIMIDCSRYDQLFLGLDSTKTNYPTADAKLTYDSLYFVRQFRQMKEQHPPDEIEFFRRKI